MANNKSTISQYSQGYTYYEGKRQLAAILDIDRIKNNPLYKCTVTGGKVRSGDSYVTGSIVGIYNPDSPFSMSTSSDYTDTFTLPFQDKLDKLNEVGAWAQNMSGRTQFIIKSIRMTEQRWTGSTAPDFNIKIDIPIVRPKDGEVAWDSIRYFLQATCGSINDYAGTQKQSMESAWQIFAPNGYKVTYKKDSKSGDVPSGTYSISLGEGKSRWFSMTNALITNASPTISGKKYYDGNPTSISLNISFKYWRQPMYEDIINWFPKMK